MECSQTLCVESRMAPPPPLPPAVPPSRPVTEDTPPDMLAGTMDLVVLLPNGRTSRMSVDRSTPMMDLLIHVTTANKISPGGHIIQAMSDRGRDILPYKPSTPIGALETTTIQIVPKNRLNSFSNKKAPLKPSNQPFEQTFRLQVHLPRNQMAVMRVSAQTQLLDILKQVCVEKNLEASKYEIRHPISDDLLSPTNSLADYKLQEVRVVPKGSKPMSSGVTSNDILALQKEDEKRKKGVFGFMFKRSRSSMGESSVSSDSMGGRSSRGISPARSDESLGRSVSPPLATTAPPTAPPRPKKRPAPKPPGPPKNSQTTDLPSPHQIPSSTPSPNADPSQTVSHSRTSSDSSGYHEASVLSESPDTHGGSCIDSPPDTLLRNKNRNRNSNNDPKFSISLSNLTGVGNEVSTNLTSVNSVSTTSLSSVHKKRKAPAPPPKIGHQNGQQKKIEDVPVVKEEEEEEQNLEVKESRIVQRHEKVKAPSPVTILKSVVEADVIVHPEPAVNSLQGAQSSSPPVPDVVPDASAVNGHHQEIDDDDDEAVSLGSESRDELHRSFEETIREVEKTLLEEERHEAAMILEKERHKAAMEKQKASTVHKENQIPAKESEVSTRKVSVDQPVPSENLDSRKNHFTEVTLRHSGPTVEDSTERITLANAESDSDINWEYQIPEPPKQFQDNFEDQDTKKPVAIIEDEPAPPSESSRKSSSSEASIGVKTEEKHLELTRRIESITADEEVVENNRNNLERKLSQESRASSLSTEKGFENDSLSSSRKSSIARSDDAARQNNSTVGNIAQVRRNNSINNFSISAYSSRDSKEIEKQSTYNTSYESNKVESQQTLSICQENKTENHLIENEEKVFKKPNPVTKNIIKPQGIVRVSSFSEPPWIVRRTPSVEARLSRDDADVAVTVQRVPSRRATSAFSMDRTSSLRNLDSMSTEDRSQPPLLIKQFREKKNSLRRTSSEFDVNGGEAEGDIGNALEEQKRLQEEYTKLQEQFLRWQEQLLQNQTVLQGHVGPSLQSLQVIKDIIPSISQSQSMNDLSDSKESLNDEVTEVEPVQLRSKSLPRQRLVQSVIETSSIEIEDVPEPKPSPVVEKEKEKEKRYSYQGPPAINFTTWSERPKVEVSLKHDSDYKIGVGQGSAKFTHVPPPAKSDVITPHPILISKMKPPGLKLQDIKSNKPQIYTASPKVVEFKKPPVQQESTARNRQRIPPELHTELSNAISGREKIISNTSDNFQTLVLQNHQEDLVTSRRPSGADETDVAIVADKVKAKIINGFDSTRVNGYHAPSENGHDVDKTKPVSPLPKQQYYFGEKEVEISERGVAEKQKSSALPVNKSAPNLNTNSKRNSLVTISSYQSSSVPFTENSHKSVVKASNTLPRQSSVKINGHVEKPVVVKNKPPTTIKIGATYNGVKGAPTVKGFAQIPASKPLNGVPPPPPPAPPIIEEMKTQKSGSKSAPSTLKKGMLGPQLDPREQLMLAIRSCGQNTLKKTGTVLH